MDVILYKYDCPRWYGILSGIKNISTENDISDEVLTANLTQIENNNTGSKSCKIDLLQKYELTIKNVHNYQGITTIPINNIKDYSLEKKE